MHVGFASSPLVEFQGHIRRSACREFDNVKFYKFQSLYLTTRPKLKLLNGKHYTRLIFVIFT